MNDWEWLNVDIERLPGILWEWASERKYRLLACGCCRLLWASLPDERSRKVVEVAERCADGLASEEEVRHAAYRAEAAVFAIDAKAERHRREKKGIRCGWLPEADAVEQDGITGLDGQYLRFEDARRAASAAAEVSDYLDFVLRGALPAASCIAVAHDILRNPFRPVAVDPQWLTSDVLALARGIYDERAFDRMPILADALQDAGCDSAPVLDHCRDPNGVHVRGCWVVDLLLGKS